jgi:hypothetical protein
MECNVPFVWDVRPTQVAPPFVVCRILPASPTIKPF